MSDIKKIVGRKMQQDYKFCGESVKISKLTVQQVLEIQTVAKDAEKDDTKGYDVLKTVVKFGLENSDELSDDDFSNLPLDELSKLSAAIMKFSGLGEQGK
jgi:hypothetical protein